VADASKFTISNYVVAYIDILGQQEALKKFPAVLNYDTDLNLLSQAMQETYVKIQEIRNYIKTFFEDKSKQKVGSAVSDRLSDKKRKDVERFEGEPIEFQHQGDYVVIYNKLNNYLGEPCVKPIWMMIGAIAGLLLDEFSKHTPIRGSIEIGVAADWDNFGIYGSAFFNAYKLERYVADYPRIVLGDEIFKYLSFWANNPKEDNVTKWNKELATRCLSIICKDRDDKLFLDFLSEKMSAFFGHVYDFSAPHICEQVLRGSEFAKQQYEHFKGKDPKLERRYKSLFDYYDNWQQNY